MAPSPPETPESSLEFGARGRRLELEVLENQMPNSSCEFRVSRKPNSKLEMWVSSFTHKLETRDSSFEFRARRRASRSGSRPAPGQTRDVSFEFPGNQTPNSSCEFPVSRINSKLETKVSSFGLGGGGPGRGRGRGRGRGGG